MMSTLVRKHLKDDLAAQLIALFEVKSLDDLDLYLVITPLLYPDNSHVCLYAEELEKGQLAISDNAEGSAYAWVLGVSEADLEDRVRRVKRRFRLLPTESHELRLEVPHDQLVESVFTLAAAVQDVANLVYKNRDY
jgi:hypothetical protein